MSSNWRIGERIEDRWEVYQTLTGGMNPAYVVYDHAAGAFVVAKTLQNPPAELNAQGSSGFPSETMAWIGLERHDNITQALFALEIELKPYLFLEYVAGGDLRRWIGTPRLTADLPQVVRFAVQFCDGMIHAATNGVALHGNIKPENCLITEEPVLRITDFGVAAGFHDDPATDSKDVQEPVAGGDEEPARAAVATAAATAKTGLLRRIWGSRDSGAITTLNLSRAVPRVTPRLPAAAGTDEIAEADGRSLYMAPEQFSNSAHVDVRADVYAFGVMLYEMISGRRPFAGATLRELVQQQRNDVAPSLACFEPLETLVGSCLSREPADRPADFQAIRLTLAHIYEAFTGEAVPHARSGTELNISDLLNKAAALIQLDRPEEALACSERALALDESHTGAWIAKGNVLSHLKRFDAALVCYERVLERDPDSALAGAGKDLVRRSLERSEEWFNKGHRLARLDLYPQALEAYERALELRPKFQQAWAGQADVLRRLRRFDDALNSCDRALEFDPGDDRAWTIKAEILIDTGNGSDATVCLDRAVELNPKTNQGWLKAGFSLLKVGTADEALRCFDKGLRRNEGSEQGWFGKAKALAMLEQWEESLSCFDRALERNPFNLRTTREKAIVSGYMEQARGGITGGALRQAIEFRRLARVALAGGRVVSRDLAKTIQTIVQQNALHIEKFQEKRSEFAKINSGYLLLHAAGLTLLMMGAGEWSQDKLDAVVRSAAQELVWIAGAFPHTEPVNDQDVAASLRGQYADIRQFLSRWSELKSEQADEEAELLLVAEWFPHIGKVCPACDGLLAGRQAESIVATKLVKALSQRSLALGSQAWRNVEVI
jgi:tetratricopeptide (TPR) repeat protein